MIAEEDFLAFNGYQPIEQDKNIANKRRVLALMDRIMGAAPARLAAAVRAAYHPQVRMQISHPINEMSGLNLLLDQFWRPLRHALPDGERRTDILAGGIYRGEQLVGCLGHYVGSFENDWLGIPASRGVVALRFAEGHALRDGQIVWSVIFLDFLDLMRQVGYWPIAPSLGREMGWLAPRTHDGVILTPQDHALSRQTMSRILRMWEGLDIYEGQILTKALMDRIEQEDARHFHPQFMWHGPAGIGTTRGVAGFDAFHGHPFLMAFPDRGGSEIGHFIQIADGRYAVTGGWGHLRATHTGNDFLGLPATGRPIAMRVMDFYRCNDETICENWVPIDIPHILLQMGIDIFGRMRHQFRQTGKLNVRDWLLRSY